MNRKWHNHNLYSVLETKTQTTKALIQHVFGVSDQETDLVRILKFRSPNRITVLYKITSWTGDFLVYVDGGMLKYRTSMIPYFLKKILSGDIKFEFDCSYVVLLCNTPHRNSTIISFFLYLQCIKTCNMKNLT